MYGQNWAIHSIKIIIKTLSYLLKINKRTNKKYLCDRNFEMHLYCHFYVCERRFLAHDNFF